MIPSTVTQAISNLAYTQSLLGPFLQASVSARLNFEQQIANVEDVIDTAIVNAVGLLDSKFSGDAYPTQTVSDLTSLYTSSNDQYTLANLEGVIGRLLLNVQITYSGGGIPITQIVAQPSLDYSQPQDSQYLPGL